MEKRWNLYRKVLQKEPVLFDITEKLAEKEKELTPQNITMLYVMAPIMCKYVLWVLKEALESGKKRLYFLARDGYSMYCTAKVFCEKLDIPIECRYLYCSRYAWRSAEYGLLGKDSLAYICLGGIEVTFSKMMKRAGLSFEEAMEVACQLGFEKEMDRVLSYTEVKAMEPVLADCPLFLEKLEAHAREKYPAVCAYLRQEGLLEEIPYAIVDSGWTGSMQKCLQHLLKSMGYEEKAEGYYFGMYEYPPDIEKQLYHTYYFSPEEELKRKVYFSNSLFECIFSSPEGMTVGYQACEKKSTPAFEKPENPNKKKIESSTACLERYAAALADSYGRDILHTTEDFRDTAAQLLYYFMGKPAVEEAEEFGSYIFCDDVIGEEAQQVASKLTAKEVKENRVLNKGFHLLLKKGKPVKESAWPEASAVLAKGAGRGELRHCALYKYILYLRKSRK